MKRGKEGEKIMGPMFPRLHVNDTEKGGPRAPPRNKMALYEQLTIPSQRYDSSVAPPKPNSNSKLAPSTSTSQGTSREQNTYFPLYRPPSAPAYDEIHVRDAEASNSNNQLARVENKKKPLEEDDFMVPIFSEAGTKMHNEKTPNSVNEERHLSLNSNQQRWLPITVSKEINQSNNGHLVPKQQINDHDERSMRVFASSRSSLDISMSGMDDTPWQNDASSSREHQEKQRLRSSKNSGVCLLEDHKDSLPTVDSTLGEDVPDLHGENQFKDTSLRLSLNSRTRCGVMVDIDSNGGVQRIDDNLYLEKENIDRGDDVSETSMVDSASEFDITRDDVVDIIGRKQFWKARAAIVNQQRVFALQVFELHRLLKVQKLIAGSPNLLLEASAFVGKSSEYVVKALPHKGMQNDVTQRTNDKVEATAENAVPKASPPVLSKHPIQPVGYPSFSNNTVLFPPGGMEPKMNTWGFLQPSAHQWLVPVMTPSEGLVYKPYPAPGFMGPICGGCGPMVPTPTTQYQQGMGMPPGIHLGVPGYFPPYGMSMMSSGLSSSTVDHLNPFTGSNQYSQTGQPDTVTSSPATRPRPSRQGEQHGSTASSPSGKTQGTGTSRPKGRDANHLFAPPPTTEFPLDTPPREKQAKVIRAVPCRSTSDSAARIFQSIQQERLLPESS